MSGTVVARPLTQSEFAPFGEILEPSGSDFLRINQGKCKRFNDLAALDFDPPGCAGISIFDAEPRSLPYQLDMVERHPLGSQAFVPMCHTGFLIIVAPDENDRPGTPLAFVSQPGQAINFFRNTWHGVLTPLHAPGLFAVVDRIGAGNNLEEVFFDTPWTIVAGDHV